MLGHELDFLNINKVTKGIKLSVVMSREEIGRLAIHFQERRLLMFQLMYGVGLRHNECRRLRIKDICFDQDQIVVRDGKGERGLFRGCVFDGGQEGGNFKERGAAYVAVKFCGTFAGGRRGYTHGSGTASA